MSCTKQASPVHPKSAFLFCFDLFSEHFETSVLTALLRNIHQAKDNMVPFLAKLFPHFPRGSFQ